MKLVITVDCGIRSPDEALHARTLGLDLIVSDEARVAAIGPSGVSLSNISNPFVFTSGGSQGPRVPGGLRVIR